MNPLLAVLDADNRGGVGDLRGVPARSGRRRRRGGVVRRERMTGLLHACALVLRKCFPVLCYKYTSSSALGWQQKFGVSSTLGCLGLAQSGGMHNFRALWCGSRLKRFYLITDSTPAAGRRLGRPALALCLNHWTGEQACLPRASLAQCRTEEGLWTMRRRRTQMSWQGGW